MQAIEYYSDRRKEDWDAFVNRIPDANLFQLIAWKEAVEKVYGHKPHYMMSVEDDRICGVLPLFEVKSKLFGHSLVSVPFGVYGGIAAESADVESGLRKSAVELGNLLGVDYVELRGLPHEGPLREGDCPGDTDEASAPCWHKKSLYVTFMKDILPSEDENLKSIPKKQRAMVRKGIKNGLTSVTGRDKDFLDTFYAIYAQNLRDLGTPVFPKLFFETLLELFPSAFILLVQSEGKNVAGVLSFAYRNMIMPYYGAGLREYFNLRINDFMYWELMCYGLKHGFEVFDFGRSKRDTGSFSFKCHWGFEPQELDYRTRLIKSQDLPNLSPNNPKYRLFIESWKKLPLPLANFLGPKIVKYIP
jgi:FemAB-related protein (PEP-CTERM system-associated)